MMSDKFHRLLGLPLFNTMQIKQLEHGALQSDAEMMERAGRAAFLALQKQWPKAQRLAVFCGKGDNAGDAFVLARLAALQGLMVCCYLMTSVQQLTSKTAYEAAKLCEQADVIFQPFDDGIDITADVIVDGLLGIGLKGAPCDLYAQAIKKINQTTVPVLSLDVPSGLNADTGEVISVAVKASLTVSMVAAKRGLFTYQASTYTGKVLVDDLGLPQAVFSTLKPDARLLDAAMIQSMFPIRHRDAHKGHYGHVLVVGGDYGMGGAVRMAAEAALRVGAGLVSVATRPEHVCVVNTTCPEIMCHEIRQASDIESLLSKATTLVVGPGLGQSTWARELFDVLVAARKPTVMDADSLNLLSKEPQSSEFWILTPHPGEAARLLSTTRQSIQKDRFSAVRHLSSIYGGVAVLKGCGSLIDTQGQACSVCPLGNPGMATAGMGDILSGMIGGLLAQNLTLWQAAQAGVWLHAKAADLAAELEGERGLLATDLLKYLRKCVNPEKRR